MTANDAATNTDSTDTHPRDKHTIADSNLLREYGAPSEHLYAYRDTETDEHVVVTRNTDVPFVKRVPADRHDVETGTRMWTIPDSWTKIARVTLHDFAEAIYRDTSDGTDYMLYVPTNNWVDDAMYKVIQRGALTVSIETLGTASEIRSIVEAEQAAMHNGSTMPDEVPYDMAEYVEALERTADHWDTFLNEDVPMIIDTFKEEHFTADDRIAMGDSWDIETGGYSVHVDQFLEHVLELPTDLRREVDSTLRSNDVYSPYGPFTIQVV